MITDNLTETLRNDLATGHYGESGRIPPLRNLAERYSCSPASMKRAIDNLQREGLLVSIHGKGTFLMNGTSPGGHIRRSRVIGTIVLDDPAGREIGNQKEKWLNEGWFLATYNATLDHQAPARESGFLKRAEAEGFFAVILVATPLEPTNAELFMKLRLGGMKIAHLTPYRDDMSRESYFMPDWRAAGQLAVSQAAMRGYRNVVYVKEGLMTPFKKLQLDGIREMCAGLGLQLLPSMDATDLEEAGKYPENTVFLCSSSLSGKKIHEELLSLGCRLPEQFGVISLCEDLDNPCERDCMIFFDYARQINAAMEYSIDDKFSSLEPVQKLFPPIFREGNTLRARS